MKKIIALYLYYKSAERIQNNLITNCTIGINIDVFVRNWFSPNIPLVQNNMITKNLVGIRFEINTQEPYGDRIPTIIKSNTISQNSIGMKLGGFLEQCTIQNNNIQDNSECAVYMEARNNFNVTNNWWGTTDTSAIEKSIYDFNEDFNLGKITFVPFLTEPNPQAIPDLNAPMPVPNPSPSLEPEPTSPSDQDGTIDQLGQSGNQDGTQVGFNVIEIAILAVLVVIAVSLIVLIGFVLKKRR